jgi:AraC-like DNA-binding protein
MYSNELVCELIRYINNNYKKDISIDELVFIFNYNNTYIMKSFKKYLNITIKEYLNYYKIYQSLDEYPNDSILKIALNNGFNSLEYYSETFKKIMKVSPIKYKKFVNNKYSISDNEINKIIESINKLKLLNNKISKYLLNQRPKEKMVKELTIFRKY